jgi:hypothetical protein
MSILVMIRENKRKREKRKEKKRKNIIYDYSIGYKIHVVKHY